MWLDAAISLQLRSCRDERPEINKVTSDAIISNLVLPAPPKIRYVYFMIDFMFLHSSHLYFA